jgi:CelD/BcsL family acetyltransferase involved in cellulose biosynthesis
MRLETEIITHPAALAALVPQWRRFWRDHVQATPFQSPDWLLPWWDLFAPGTLRVIAIRREGRLCGIAPLYRETGRFGARLLPIGIALSDYVDVLLDPACEAEAAAALSDAMFAMDDIDAVEFGELAPDAQALALPAETGWEALVTMASCCPVLTLPGSMEKLADHVPPSRLRHLHTARRRAARRGECIIIQGDPDNADALLSELVRLHGRRWRATGEPGLFEDPRVAQFHAAALPRLVADNIARLYGLSIGDTMAGVYYGFHHRGRAYAYLCGHDPDFRFESPGAILIGHAIGQAMAEGAGEFHFLRGQEAYKYEWGAKDRTNRRRLFVRTGKGRSYG